MSQMSISKPDAVFSDCEDSDDDKEDMPRKQIEPGNLEDVSTWSHDQRRKPYYDDHPTRKALKKLGEVVMDKVIEANNSPQFRQDAKADTIAVGLSNGQIIITGNVKTRRETDSADKTQYIKLKTPDGSKQKAKYDDYGINEDLSNVILSEVKKSSVYKNSHLDVKVVEEKHNPRDNPKLEKMIDKASDHASKHAETKMQAYCEQTESELRKVAVSKPPCKGCHEDLSKEGVAMVPETPGTKKVTNRKEVDKEEVEVRNRIDRKKEVEVGLQLYSSNIHLSTKAFKQTVKSTVKRSVKPGGSVGIISGIAQIKDTIENESIEAFADGGLLNAGAGVVENLLGGQTCYARTSVIEGRTGFGDLASIGASALSAGAHAEYGWNNSVGVDASVVRVNANIGPVQAGVGLNFDTHASVGVNGVSASFLGTGFSFGPRIGIRTPFFDFSITLF